MPPKPRNATNRSLPSRWRYRRGFYWYRVPRGMEPYWDEKTEYKLGKTEAEAYAEFARKMAQNQPIEVTRINDLFDRVMAETFADMPPKRAETYTLAMKRLRPVFGGLAIDEVKPKDVLRYADLCAKKVERESQGRYKGVTTCRRDVEVLSACLSQAVIWGLLDANRLLGIKKPRTKPRRRYLAGWEIAQILTFGANGNLPNDKRRLRTIQVGKLYCALKLMTGLRRRDLLTLRLDQITDDGILVTHSKTEDSSGKTTLYEWDEQGLLREAVRLFEEMPPTVRQPYLIVTRKGRCYYNLEKDSANAWDSLWQRFVAELLERTEIREPFQERDLRATTATLSEDAESARARLGHASIDTTNKVYRRGIERTSPLILQSMQMTLKS